MTKKIIKLGALLVTATLMTATAALSNIAYADRAADLEQLRKALDDVTPCIDENDENSPDAGKIITIIEEPLGSGPAEVGDTEVRPCFRNTFQYMDGAESPTLPLLGRNCSNTAKGLISNTALKTYNPRFSCTEIQVLLSKGGTSLIYAYIGIIYRWGASMVGIVAVLIIVLSGIQISAAGGDPDAITKAKTRILQSIAGIVVLFLSGLILYTINPNFFISSDVSPEVPAAEEAPAGNP